MNSAQRHTITLDSRRELKITAVEEVLSFDESSVSLSVGDSVLNIGGEGLSITDLSLGAGEITVSGSVSALVYYDSAPRRKRFGLFGKA
ncbi:MAG: YabP/YqfC family sporulation protein [Clostridia bacterium]|nr:YabP/YqfC family sporulation protein [Clostridia bacterium]